MEAYQLKPKGSFYVQIVDTLPAWLSINVGRILYDNATQSLYFGDNDSWVSIPPSKGDIKADDIDWDININDTTGQKVSAKNVPCLFVDVALGLAACSTNTDITPGPSDVQTALDDLSVYLRGFLSGKKLGVGIIKSIHVDSASGDGLKASDIMLKNTSGYFGPTQDHHSIEKILEDLVSRRAGDIFLDLGTKSGNVFTSEGKTIQDNLNELNAKTFDACHILADVVYPISPGCCEGLKHDSSVQDFIDYVVRRLENFTFQNDLVDTPDNLGDYNQVLKTTGGVKSDELRHKYYWGFIPASEVPAVWPGGTYKDLSDIVFESVESNAQEIIAITHSLLFNHRSRIEILETVITALNERVNTLEINMDVAQNAINDLENKVIVLENKVEPLEIQVDKNTNDITTQTGRIDYLASLAHQH
jgi:hypothetical protein